MVGKLMDEGDKQQLDCESAREFLTADVHSKRLLQEFDAVYNPLKVSFSHLEVFSLY